MNIVIQPLEYVIHPPPPAAAAPPKSPICHGVSLCYGVSHVMVLAMLWS